VPSRRHAGKGASPRLVPVTLSIHCTQCQAQAHRHRLQHGSSDDAAMRHHGSRHLTCFASSSFAGSCFAARRAASCATPHSVQPQAAGLHPHTLREARQAPRKAEEDVAPHLGIKSSRRAGCHGRSSSSSSVLQRCMQQSQRSRRGWRRLAAPTPHRTRTHHCAKIKTTSAARVDSSRQHVAPVAHPGVYLSRCVLFVVVCSFVARAASHVAAPCRSRPAPNANGSGCVRGWVAVQGVPDADKWREQMEQYHKAIARGRHPISFSRNIRALWQLV
jgi:hypothetical protein